MNLHPYKWCDTEIKLPIPERFTEENITKDSSFDFLLKADLKSNRYNVKIEGEKHTERSLLSAQRAILIQIIEDNYQDRDICFTNCSDLSMQGGLDAYLQNWGMISVLNPFVLEEEKKSNIEKIKLLLIGDKLKAFKGIRENNIPRIANITSIYISALLTVFSEAIHHESIQIAEQYYTLYKSYLMSGLDVETEEYYLKIMEKYLKR